MSGKLKFRLSKLPKQYQCQPSKHPRGTQNLPPLVSPQAPLYHALALTGQNRLLGKQSPSIIICEFRLGLKNVNPSEAQVPGSRASFTQRGEARQVHNVLAV